MPAETTYPCYTPEELADWTGGVWSHPPARLCGVCHDSQAVWPGCLYVALQGTRRDGHVFVAAALAAGAAAALVRQGWPSAPDVPLLRVADPHAALTAAAAGYRRAVAPFVIGVTGSVGKTTVKELTFALLAAAAPAAATRGNWNNDVGLPLSLLAMPRATRYGVFELGTNHPGEIAPLARLLQPDAAVLTPIGPVHIENFGSVEAIADEKAELIRAVPPGGFVVLEAAAAHADRLRRRSVAHVVTVSLDSPAADFHAEAIDEVAGALTVVEGDGGARQALTHGRPGRHQALNVLLAVAAARSAHVSWPTLVDGLAAAALPPMRWERLAIGDLDVINDAYNANPLSMHCALSTFAAHAAPGRRLLVLGDMRELGALAEAAHRELGRRVAAGPWQGLLAVGTLAAWIADEAVRCGFGGWIRCVPDAAAAGAVLAAETRPGDSLLLKASRGIGLERALGALYARAGVAPTADNGDHR